LGNQNDETASTPILGKLEMRNYQTPEIYKWKRIDFDFLETRNCVVVEPAKLKSERSDGCHSAKLSLITFEIMKPFN
jgi:hypothetical protein